MNITIVYLSYYQGAENMSPSSRRVRDIGRGLVASGHKVTIALPKRIADEQDVSIEGLSLVFLGTNCGSRIANRWHYWKSLVKHAKQAATDWVLFYYIRGDAVLTAHHLKASGCRVATIYSDKHSVNYGWRNITKWPLWASIKSGEVWLPKVSDLNICISRMLLEDCKKYAPDIPTFMLPVLVDHGQFSPSPDRSRQAETRWKITPDALVVGYLGGLWKHHGVGDLIAAFAQIVKKHSNARLFIAGKRVIAESHDDIRALTKAQGIEDQVILSDWLETDEVVNIYNRIDILVLPQHNTAGIQAGLPTKIAEYSQMGKAIIATRSGDIPKYFEDGTHALLVPPKDPQAMAIALHLLFSNSNLRMKLGRNAAQLAHDYFEYRNACRPLAKTLEKLGRVDNILPEK